MEVAEGDTPGMNVAALAERHKVPTVYQWREFAAAGGLMSYGISLSDGYRWVGEYAARLLGGAKPADLPVQAPTKYELVINLKTAKRLGLTVPNTLQVAADELDIRHRLADPDSGDLGDDVVQAFDVLHVQRRVDIDPARQDFLDIEVALEKTFLPEPNVS